MLTIGPLQKLDFQNERKSTFETCAWGESSTNKKKKVFGSPFGQPFWQPIFRNLVRTWEGHPIGRKSHP